MSIDFSKERKDRYRVLGDLIKRILREEDRPMRASDIHDFLHPDDQSYFTARTIAMRIKWLDGVCGQSRCTGGVHWYSIEE